MDFRPIGADFVTVLVAGLVWVSPVFASVKARHADVAAVPFGED